MEETTRVGIYARLSRDDERFGESMSIENQKLMLIDYCDRQGWEIIDVYADDGFTGLTFDRPEMQRLIEDAKNGRINTVLVKDLSRFGRNYVEAGQLIDDLFPLLNIRLVAPNDGVDTHTNQNTDFIPMKRKLFRFISVSIAFILCAVSCNKKPKPEEIVGDVQIEDYYIGDAKEITVPITDSGNEPPVNFQKIELPDFDKKKPQCCTDPSQQDSFYLEYDPDFYEKPCPGRMIDYSISGDHIYFSLDYDHYDYNSHETALVDYNRSTGEFTELYAHSSAEEDECFNDIAAVGNKLYSLSCKGYMETAYHEISEIDLESGERKFILENPTALSGEILNYNNELYYCYFEPDPEKYSSDGLGKYIIKKYNAETDEWSDTITEIPSLTHTFFSKDSKSYFFGDVFCTAVQSSEDKCITFEVKDRFTLKTDFKNAHIIGADENSVHWIVENHFGSYTDLYLYSFNAEKNEVYKTKLIQSSNIDIIPAGGGCIIMTSINDNSYNTVHYLIPEIGLSFLLAEETVMYSKAKNESGVTSFCEQDENYVCRVVYCLEASE